MTDTQYDKLDELPSQEAAKFLERDFNQCFTQLRHHDSQIWDISKFTFTAYTALIGIAIGLYRYSVDTNRPHLTQPAMSILLVGFLLGLFMLLLTVRNRSYYVLLSRYINEHRNHYLAAKPLGFRNVSGMYTDPTKPPFFNPRSSHAWLAYIMAGLNSLLLAVAVYIACENLDDRMAASAVVFLIVLAVQLLAAAAYLRSHERATGTPSESGDTANGNTAPS